MHQFSNELASIRPVDEFSRLYPDADRSDLPAEVSEMEAQGVPIAAAYALYLRREQYKSEQAARKNSEHASSSPGGADAEGDVPPLTVEEIKKLPQSAVRRYYSQILRVLSGTR